MNWVLIAKIIFTIWATFDFFYHIKKSNEIQVGYFILVWLIATRNFF